MVGLKQDELSPCLFSVFSDGLVREVNARVSERKLSMRVDRARFELNKLLFEGGAVFTADLEELLQFFVSIFWLSFKR